MSERVRLIALYLPQLHPIASIAAVRGIDEAVPGS
jgi:hypothetical protein